jgi:hypothetical protein
MTFEVSVVATPDDATFEVDGVPLGSGRLAQTFPRDGRRHVLRAYAPGHETVLVEFDETRPPPAQIALRPVEPEAAPASTPAAATAGAGAATAPPVSTSAPKHAAHPAHTAPPPPAHTNKGSDGRPRTDNINPWE